MTEYVVALTKPWNVEKYKDLKLEGNWRSLTSPNGYRLLKIYKPRYVFFVHWSWLVPEEIYLKYECIGFHIGDLPLQRGGSPVQNMILEGVSHTKLSAFRIGKGIDTGDIYMKRDVCLNGTAEEIYIRVADVIFGDMIPNIVSSNLVPVAQQGKGMIYTRRKPEDSEVNLPMSLRQLYDFVRMLDCESYPPAFIRYGNLRIEFARASLKADCIVADARIKEDE